MFPTFPIEVARRAGLALFATIGALAATSSLAADPVTQCRVGEQPLFSCSVGKKIVSLCGASVSGASASLAYRFGLPGKVENEFVATMANGNRFHTTVVTLAPRANVVEIWFDRGEVRYVMNTCMGGDCPSEAALTVLERGNIVVRMPCKDDGNLRGVFSSDLIEFGDSLEHTKPKTPLLVVDDNYDNDADKVFVIPGMVN